MSRLVVALLVTLTAGCTQGREQAPKPEPAPVVEPAPAKPIERAEPVAIAVSRAGVQLGVIELRPDVHGVLKLAGDSTDAQELQKLWTELDARDGIGLDMHLPPEDGEERGAYGTRIMRPGESGYEYAVQHELERAGFDVRREPLAEQK